MQLVMDVRIGSDCIFILRNSKNKLRLTENNEPQNERKQLKQSSKQTEIDYIFSKGTL